LTCRKAVLTSRFETTPQSLFFVSLRRLSRASGMVHAQTVDLTGQWDVVVTTKFSQGKSLLALEQKGQTLTGTSRSVREGGPDWDGQGEDERSGGTFREFRDSRRGMRRRSTGISLAPPSDLSIVWSRRFQ
jgi:hypothetical protein